MRKAFLFVYAAIALSTSSSIAAEVDVCRAYPEVNARLGCDQNNYLIQFGERYCVEFVERNDEFEPATQTVLQSIRHCLVRDIQTDTGLTCENAEETAIHSHYRCYTDAGFCSLPLGEKLKIWWVVKSETLRPSFAKAMKLINDSCH